MATNYKNTGRKLIHQDFVYAIKSSFTHNLYAELKKFSITDSQFDNWSKHINRIDPNDTNLISLAKFIGYKGKLSLNI